MDLEKRVSELENIVKKDSFKAFGRAYFTAGSTNSDYLIKTKGLVKIQYGSKFIDLIKDGKVNADANFIYKEESVGSKDGIYVIGDGEDVLVVLSIGGTLIDLKGDIGTTYVSFQAKLNTTSEEKYTALLNIGFIYKSLDDVAQDGLQNGIIYVESEHKLYVVLDGSTSEFNISIPNPFTELFVIKKDNSLKGSLLILGNGINNSLAFDKFYLYSDLNSMYFDSIGDMYFTVANKEKIRITSNDIIFYSDTTSNMFKSTNATASNGFRLYFKNGQSTLEVDNAIIRNLNLNEVGGYLYPTRWDFRVNTITNVEIDLDSSTEQRYIVTLTYLNLFEPQDKVYIYYLERNDDGFYDLILLPCNVEEVNDNSIYISIIKDLIDPSKLTQLENGLNLSLLNGQSVFLIAKEYPIILKRLNLNNIDLVESLSLLDAIENINVKSRFGNIEELLLYGRDNEKESLIQGSGIFSDNGVFLKALYTKDYNLLDNDNSTKFASTEWVNKLLNSNSTEDIDLYYDNSNAKESDISNWISNNPGLIDVILSATIEKSSISCKNGIITILLIDNKVRLTAFVVALTDDNTISHRSIDCLVDPVAYNVDSLSTYILFTRYAGYYYSKEADPTETYPILFFYYGTDKSGFTVNSLWKYLWYWNNILWELVDKYVASTKQFIFIKSTDSYSYTDDSTGTGYLLPGGFISYIKGATYYLVGFGKSNYIPNNTTHDISTAISRLTTLSNLVINPTYNIRPTDSRYNYLWCIEASQEFTNVGAWQIVSSKKSSDSINTKSTFEVGNCSTPSNLGWDLYRTDNSGKAIDLDLGSIEFKKGAGTIDNWKDRIWVKSFIRYALCTVLSLNKDRYNSISGWDFHWDIISVLGYGGYVGFYLGEPLPPTSDIPNDSGYYPRVTSYMVSGNLCSYGYSVLFLIYGLTLGKLYENIGMGLDLLIGLICSYRNFFYDVDFTSYQAVITELGSGKIENITG